jgi:predicted PurR-regulated permease PerM
MSNMSPEGVERKRALFSTVVLAAAIVVFALVAWQIARVFLVVFAAVLFAIFLNGIARFIERFLPIGHRIALALGILLVVALLAGAILFAGPQINDQVSRLGNQLPEAIDKIENILREYSWGRALLRSPPEASELVDGSGEMLGHITGLFSSALAMVADVLIILVVGIYIAIDPRLYVRGMTLLVPPKARPRVKEALEAVGNALGWWLVGQFGSMAIIGVLTGVGLWMIGMPLALVLGLIAGIFSFIPMLGPIIAAIPGLLIALMQDPMLAAYAALVYWIAQMIEGNVVTPLIQKRTVALAPAVLIMAQLLMGVLFGFNGVVLATPMVVAIMVLIQMLYVQDMLDTDVAVLGDHH